jgi:hypothetical protein
VVDGAHPAKTETAATTSKIVILKNVFIIPPEMNNELTGV